MKNLTDLIQENGGIHIRKRRKSILEKIGNEYNESDITCRRGRDRPFLRLSVNFCFKSLRRILILFIFYTINDDVCVSGSFATASDATKTVMKKVVQTVMAAVEEEVPVPVPEASALVSFRWM